MYSVREEVDSLFDGSLLRRAREREGYSQTELAKESGIAQHTISRVENGVATPRGYTLRHLTGAPGRRVSDFFVDEGGAGGDSAA